ncbi:MAG: DUF192 domain-containing protein [Sedimentisphaerales bacterium]|nr:DUF192 domain-containing protein [Sedimentisphaerales bacterium]
MFTILLIVLLFCPNGACKKEMEPPPAVSNQETIRPTGLPVQSMEVGGELFQVELAYTQQDRARGLMYRRELAPDAGMLFIFEREKIRQFYMKNCLIDIDIVFFRADGEITHVTTMKVPVPGQPLTLYSSQAPAKYALELPAGAIQRLKLQPGQKIQIPAAISNIIPEPQEYGY